MKATLSLLGVLLVPRAAHADVVWPALFVEQRLLSVPAIVAGLLVELALLALVYELPLRRAALVDVVMNVASMSAGTLLIPLAGIGWELFPGWVLYRASGIGTFNPWTWSATFVMAVIITSLIERLVITRAFDIPVDRRRFVWLCAANAVSVGIAFGSLLLDPRTELTASVLKTPPAVASPARSAP